jgi:hypothetical protein
MCKEAWEECKRLLEENKKLTNDKLWLESWNNDFVKDNQKLLDEIKSLDGENRYLKQKVKEYRHKTWFTSGMRKKLENTARN